MAARKAAAVSRGEEDERLLVEAAQQDPAKFGRLYELHFERVWAFIAWRVRGRAVAEDLTSEVFHKALANLRSYQVRGAPFAAWLLAIAANAVTDQYKRAAREAPGTRDREEPSTPPETDAIERDARLFRLVDQLPPNQRHVIYQRFVEERDIREIAQQIGRSEGAVKQLQFRAIEKLRAQMEGAHA